MRADAHCAMIVTNVLKVVGETTEAEDACGSTSRAQSIATACHRCLDVAPGEIESEPLSHLLAVSHSAATLDPRRSPKTSPNHTAAGAVKPHHKLMLLQEEARRAHCCDGRRNRRRVRTSAEPRSACGVLGTQQSGQQPALHGSLARGALATTTVWAACLASAPLRHTSSGRPTACGGLTARPN